MTKSVLMKRKNYWMPDDLIETIKAVAKQERLSESEVVRAHLRTLKQRTGPRRKKPKDKKTGDRVA